MGYQPTLLKDIKEKHHCLEADGQRHSPFLLEEKGHDKNLLKCQCILHMDEKLLMKQLAKCFLYGCKWL